jgi:hypothetical protein
VKTNPNDPRRSPMNDSSRTTAPNPDTATELGEDALEKVSGGAIYMKYEGIKGDVSRKGGNVEFEWKVEEGEY